VASNYVLILALNNMNAKPCVSTGVHFLLRFLNFHYISVHLYHVLLRKCDQKYLSPRVTNLIVENITKS